MRNHEIVPVLNKIDLPAAEPERVKQQIEDVIGLPADDAVMIIGQDRDQHRGRAGSPGDTPARRPPGDAAMPPLKALLVDSWYDQYLGVVILVRVKRRPAEEVARSIRMMSNGATHQIEQVGVFTPKMIPTSRTSGRARWASSRRPSRPSPTATWATPSPTTASLRPLALPGFKPSIPVVWCGLFPVDADDFEHLRDSLGKLRLNDASFHFEAESSAALGFGYRCGFLGLLHLEIIQERLTREFDLDLIATAPSVVYRVKSNKGVTTELHNPADMPDPSLIDHIQEPWIKATIMVPDEYLGSILTLCSERRGQQVDLTYVGNRAMAVYRLPLNEVVFDFYDRLKSVSRGYASFDYAMDGYEEGDLVRISILVNSGPGRRAELHRPPQRRRAAAAERSAPSSRS